ncbi:hypothetical protein EHI8A_075170 [Entamoeba histolytica HM-1:IMSS-B]|uniref:Uncharacterized protein n=6 Tax=Entamoeba histolytica TaxID=5759 RepID=C4M990_ENTH1|nr:hypothetical protein EHI_075670 [Entamoeba histolytica HM-1:IMSS]EMD45712.1 Hypothetical protein EHI5A_106560 [Entamoeba histolytica KU27]EMH74693.1 hypothetical protein EHI8A_075170 [Entamoeba histolytica HM-1:IMSS-B]EMS12893.1 hypothetical protein KM1_134380 [Entamoeba histolytica HM-3:IMSS]ENY61319.1 hypothetical protein EHI7A_089000 [Entamoeba histolytica HM-1:IMSS-A]GAT98222.1 hypothetical protein CL6EHI_075670 [Entamoeba histolytica]|eukprot:XP_648771.1 hypothetical protein EHI_075670 [Entamoeba histolytica HM-1:IMSS]
MDLHHFIQQQLLLLQKENKNYISIQNDIISFFQGFSNDQQLQVLADYIFYIINSVITKHLTKSLFYHNFIKLCSSLLVQIPNASTMLFQLIILPKTTFQFKKQITKLLYYFNPSVFPENSQNILKDLLFYSTSTKLQCTILSLLMKMNIKCKEYYLLLSTSSNKLLHLLNHQEIIEQTSLEVLLHLSMNTITHDNAIIILNNKFISFSSDQIRLLFHFIITSYNDSFIQPICIELLKMISNIPETLFMKLNYLIDAPLISLLSTLLLHHITPQQFCNVNKITITSNQFILHCAARVFENNQTIPIELNELYILNQLEQCNMGLIDMMIYCPQLLFKTRIKTSEIFEQLLKKSSYIYHEYSNIGIIVQCCVRLLPKESITIIINYLSNVNFNYQMSETLGWSFEYSIQYFIHPSYVQLPLMNETEKSVIIINTLLSSNQFIEPYKSTLEEQYIIPLLASRNTVVIALFIMLHHFMDDLIELLPMIIEQFWNDTNQMIHSSLLETLIHCINEYGIEKVELKLKNCNSIQHGSFHYQSVASNEITEIFQFHFDFYVDSILPRVLSEELHKPRLSKRIKFIIINGVIDMMKNDILLDPIVLSKTIIIICKDMPEYLDKLIMYCHSRDEIVEEALLSALLQLIQSKEISELLSIIKYFIQRKIIKGKRMFIGIIGELINGYSNTIKLIFMKLLNEITEWGYGWELFRGIGSVILNSIKFKGELEKERIKWLLNEEETRKEDVETIPKTQFSLLYDSLFHF